MMRFAAATAVGRFRDVCCTTTVHQREGLRVAAPGSVADGPGEAIKMAKQLKYGTYYINIGRDPKGLKKKSGKISRRKRCGFNFISYFWRVSKRAGQHEYN